jgi:tRNA nucleotidyltransferase/poly(A) polymerase
VTAVRKCVRKKQELDIKKIPQEDYANYVELIRPYTILLHLYRIFNMFYPKDAGLNRRITILEVYLGIKDPKALETKAPQANFMGDMVENAMKEFGINVKLSDIQNQLKDVMSDPKTKEDVTELAKSFTKDDIGSIFNSFMGDMKNGGSKEPKEPTENQKKLLDKAGKILQNDRVKNVFNSFLDGIENEELKSYIKSENIAEELQMLTNPPSDGETSGEASSATSEESKAE